MGNDAERGTRSARFDGVAGERCPVLGSSVTATIKPGSKGAATGCTPSTPVQLVNRAGTIGVWPRPPKKWHARPTSCALGSVSDLCRCGYV